MTSGQAWGASVGRVSTYNGLTKWCGGEKARRLTDGMTILPQVPRPILGQSQALVQAIRLPLGSHQPKTKERRRRDPLLCPFSLVTLESHNQRRRVYLSNISQTGILSSSHLLRLVKPFHSYKFALDV